MAPNIITKNTPLGVFLVTRKWWYNNYNIMHITDEQIKDFLIDTGIMSKMDLKHYNNSENLSELLVSDGKISDSDSARMKAYILGIPFIDLSKGKVSYDDLSLIPESISRKHNIVSFGKEKGKIKVAFIDPLSINNVLDILDTEHLVPYITHTNSVKRALVEYQKGLQYSFGDDIKKHAIKIKNSSDKNSVISIVDTILRHAIVQGASNIHIEEGINETIVRYRKKSVLYDAMTLPKEVMQPMVVRIKELSGIDNNGFKFTTEEDYIFVSTFISSNNEKVVMKLYSDSEDLLLEKIYFHKNNIDKLHSAINAKSGMILVSGPVKSGKTTTMYSLLDILNSPNNNIVTIESEIKRQIPRVNQVQVDRSDKEMYLRSIPGQDADVVMADNIDSSEELAILTNLSLLNHLVISSVQAETAAECLYKVSNVGIDPFILKNSIKVIVGQKNLKKLGEDKEKYNLSKAGIASLGKIIDMDRMLGILKENNLIKDNETWKNVPFYRLNKNSKYEGRIGLQEVLVISDTIKDLIMSGADIEKIEEVAQKEGMITVLEDGIIKAVMGLTTLEEVLRVAVV